jgi:hypothetical protein
MRKLVLIFLFLFASFCIVYLSCTKNHLTGKDNTIQYLAIGKKMSLSVSNSDYQRMIDPGEEDPCLSHGGQVGIGVSWRIATCKSDCNRGIGFRCGRSVYVICEDGTHIIVSQHTGNCPGGNPTNTRQMEGEIEFYDNNTAKLFFKLPMISEETNNDIFEIEENEFIIFSGYLLLDEQRYTQIKILKNDYLINYSDGEYGSVIFAVEYIQ